MVQADFSYSQAPGPDDHVGLVRLLVGDVDKDDFIFTNGEIAAVIALQPHIVKAAASLADMAAARFTRDVNVTIGATKVENEAKARAFFKLADKLRSNPDELLGTIGGAVTESMIVGGISYAAAADLVSDTDTIAPAFSLGMDDGTSASQVCPTPRSETE